jgi:tetratricopeptide (TPR) repeat protein
MYKRTVKKLQFLKSNFKKTAHNEGLSMGIFSGEHFSGRRKSPLNSGVFSLMAAFLLFVLPHSGAEPQAFKNGFGDFDHSFSAEIGIMSNFIWLNNEAAFPNNGAPAPGGDVCLSFFFTEYLGASLQAAFSTPIEDGYDPPLQSQFFVGPSFRVRNGRFATLMTPVFYFYLLFPNDYEVVVDLGAGVSLAVQYHFNSLIYIYGKVNAAYSFTGKNVAFTPAIGVGFMLADHKKGAAPAQTTPAETASAAPAETVPAEQVPAQTAPEQAPAQTAPTEQVSAQTAPEQAPAQTAPAEQALTAREYSNQGLEAYKNKDYDAAIAAYTKAMELEPDNATRKKNLATAYNARGQASFNAKNWDAAISDFSEALKLDPENTTMKRNLDSAQAGKSSSESAPAASAPTAPTLTAREYSNQGLEAYKNKDYDAAIAAYAKAMELEPENATRKKNLATAYNARGQASYTAKNWDAAISDFGEALKLDPDNAAAKRNLDRAQAGKEGDR